MSRAYIMVAPNGARLSKADHAALPLTLPEIVQTARDCHAAGADAVHLHVRNQGGAHTLDPGLYRETLAHLATDLPAMDVQITTEAVGRFSVADQLACLTELNPAWASVAVREVARDPELATRLYAQADDIGTRLQHILYDAEDLKLLQSWQKTGRVRARQNDVLFVLGRYTDGLASDPRAIAPLIKGLHPGTPWMLCAFGPTEHACLVQAVQLGGDVRVGFENSQTAADETQWRDNAASVTALMFALGQTSGAACA